MTLPPLHAVAWLVWALAAVACVQLAPSPPYVALVVAVAALVVEVHRPADGSALSRAFPAVVALGVAFGLLRVVLEALTTHGVGDALVTLPDATLPRLLGGFTVGGTVEGAVVLQAAAQAFAVVGVMAAFGAFNAVVSHHELVQSAPRAFYEPGLVVTVALAVVPSTVAAVGEIREADRARTGGRVVRRGRLLRMAVPLLETGMERAVHLAESMDSRGFGHAGGGRADAAAGWLGLGALFGLGGAFVALVGRERPLAALLAAASATTLAGAVALASAGTSRARYRRRRLARADLVVVAAAVAAPIGLAALSAGDTVLTWADAPSLPAFDLRAAAAIAALAVPALWPGARPAPPAVDHDGPGHGGRAAPAVGARAAPR